MGSSSSSSVSLVVAIFITLLLFLTDFNQKTTNSDMKPYKNIGRAQDMSSYVLTNQLARRGLIPPPAPSANGKKSYETPPPPESIS
ncbi:hypothetical protein FRX31_018193 [Thalictrum thalictroides]|uniref:Transmembrane protein n=1 Tax=Thalictrum thalictroides TaxID=46969 RepID=A0A7J6W4U1_THATH|nr:hypothetical protein FRX31_018193 [Thalictrum thalictroides]